MDPATEPTSRTSKTIPESQDTETDSGTRLKKLVAKMDVLKSKNNASADAEPDGKETGGKDGEGKDLPKAKPTVGQRLGKMFQSSAEYMTNFVNALN